MATPTEWKTVGLAVFIVCIFVLGFTVDFLPKLWRTWKGKRDPPG